MKKRFLVTLICLGILAMILSGCIIRTAKKGEAVALDSPRFVYAATHSASDTFRIIRDTETGVLYILSNNKYEYGICPLYDSNGNVMVED